MKMVTRRMHISATETTSWMAFGFRNPDSFFNRKWGDWINERTVSSSACGSSGEGEFGILREVMELEVALVGELMCVREIRHFAEQVVARLSANARRCCVASLASGQQEALQHLDIPIPIDIASMRQRLLLLCYQQFRIGR